MAGPHKLAGELGLLALVLVVGLTLASPTVLLLALPIAIHVTLGLLLTRRFLKLRATRHLSNSRTHHGDGIDVELSIENLGQHLDLVLVTEQQTLAKHVTEGTTSSARTLCAGGTLTLSYSAQPPRGFYNPAQVPVYARDLLGFTNWTAHLSCPSPLWVFPSYDPVGRVGLSPHRTLSVPGTARSRRGGEGIQFFATRPYIPGDSLRHLNWKALARRHQTVINLYEQERAAELTVVLDGREWAYEPVQGQETFEHAVRACAALCDSAIRDGHRTGLLFYGERLEWIPLGSGKVQRERLLQGLARAELGFSEAFADLGNLPSRLFPSGSSVIIVSPFTTGDEEALGMLRARGYDVLALVSEPAPSPVTESTPLGLATRLAKLERQLMLQVLRVAGVRVVVWRVDSPLSIAIKATRWRSRWS